MERRLFFLMTFLFVGIGMINAQVREVTGHVYSSEDRLPIIGASVLVEGTTQGTITGIDGDFKLSNVSTDAKTIRISYIGMKSAVIKIKSNLEVYLQPSAQSLDEVVVTAMGISKEKKALGYSVQDVKSDKLTQAASTSLSGALQGKVSGVEISPSSGMPGASSKVTIRGSRSFTGNNQPLYVVDGMPVSSNSDVSTGSSVTGSDYANRSFDIDPNDIESVNILKGQAASALYGMRASNGVIVITTKSGKGATKGRPQISYNSNFSVDVISTMPDLQTKYAQGTGGNFDPTSSSSYGPKISDLANDATYGGNVDNAYTQADGMHNGQYYNPTIAKTGLDGWVTPQSYNNADAYFQNGSTWSNSINVAQALDKGHYSFSLGNTHSEGIVPSTGSDRYNAKLNASAKLTDHWETGFSGNFINSKISKQSSGNNGIVATVYPAPPSYDLAGIPDHVVGDNTQQVNYRGTSGFDNPYWALDHNSFTERSNRFFGNAYAKYNTDFGREDMSLDVKYQVGVDSYSTNYEDLFGYGHANGSGEIYNYNISTVELNSLLTANYNWKIDDDFDFTALIGNEYVNSSLTETDAIGTNFNFSGWDNVNNASVQTVGFGSSKNRTYGFFSNLSLAWKHMLYLSASGRQDVVSSMPHGNRTFFYPSVSLGFIFTELEPLKNDILTFGKIRASYAEVGQAGSYVQSYYTSPVYGGGFSSGTPIQYPINGVSAYIPNSTVYDPNLKPQNTKSYELGLDLAFYKGLFELNYTYSRQDVKDQIFEVPLAGSTGYSELMTNGGSIHTNSHEFTITARPIQTANVNWELGVNFSKIDNYVDELAPGVESIFLGGFVTPQVRAGIGDKFPVIYGTSYKRDDQNRIIVDSDGLPEIGEEKVIGSVSPDFRVGFNTTLELYKFRLSAVLDWKQGGQMYSGTSTLLGYYGASQESVNLREQDTFVYGNNSVKELADGTYAKNDIEIAGSDAQAYYSRLTNISEASIYDNSFIKLREIALSYPVLKSPSLNIDVNIFARNLLLWTEFDSGLDPEASQGNTNMSGAFERFSLPGSSSYGMGVSLKF